MKTRTSQKGLSRREFVRDLAGGVFASYLSTFARPLGAQTGVQNDLFWVKSIPDLPFYGGGRGNYHIGVDALLNLMGSRGLKFYRSQEQSFLGGPNGLLGPEDVVLIKVNAQWKYRGATNSDLIRGLIQRILDHPDVFTGEVVIIENGQGRGSLNCDNSSAYKGNTEVHANANDERQSFLYLVETVFHTPRVSAYQLDPIRKTFISDDDHHTDGYRAYENVSYPCFATAGGRRVELAKGVWTGSGYNQNLKLINVPVLKHHDVGGSEITASLKHFYGLVSMSDGNSPFRHYAGLGETCGKMMASVATPVLNIVDAIWVSQGALKGFPSGAVSRTNQILASQDPVAIDYWAAKYILYPVDNNPRHRPDFPGIDAWLTQARDTINSRGGLRSIPKGIVVGQVTKNESEMKTSSLTAKVCTIAGKITEENTLGQGTSGVVLKGFPQTAATDSQGRFGVSTVSGWSGEVKPEKAEYSFAPEKRAFSLIASDKTAQDFVAYKTIYPPLDLMGRKLLAPRLPRGGTQILLTWRSNDKNKDRNIAKYRIYQVVGGQRVTLAELSGLTLRYLHVSFSYDPAQTYSVVAVNGSGREGPAATVTIKS